MNAVCTTFGCWAAAAAPAADAAVPFVVGSYSPFVVCDVGPPVRSATGLLSMGGPIVMIVVLDGVISIGSLAAGIGELLEEDEGRIGIDLRAPLDANGSVNGLRDIDSVVAAICVYLSRNLFQRVYVV
jgi:hypothetical protein